LHDHTHITLPHHRSIRINFNPFSFHHPPATELYTLSLHDALPILLEEVVHLRGRELVRVAAVDFDNDRVARFHVTLALAAEHVADRKSTRLNSSHSQISYAVFCLKKKNNEELCNNIGISALMLKRY